MSYLFLLVILLFLLVVVGILALVVWGVVRVASSRADEGGAASRSGAGAHSIRRLFQYVLIYAMTVLAANGVSNLLARSLSAGPSAVDPYETDHQARMLAQDLTFALIGTVVLALLLWWTRRSLRRDAEEAHSLALSLTVTSTALTALVMSIVKLNALVTALVLSEPEPSSDAAPALVWGLVWAATWVIAGRVLPPGSRLPHRALGSTVGLVTMTIGFSGLLSMTLQMLVDAETLVGGRSALISSGALLVIGAFVWLRYWILGTQSDPHSTWWLLHVLVIGVAGGLLMALTGASLTLWDVAVWLLGDPGGTSAASHFAGTFGHVAAGVTGLLVWWYHRSTVADAEAPGRTEVRRVYEYLVAGVALSASAAGTLILVVALIEAASPGQQVGTSATNSLLAALTLLVVGVPVWLLFWGRVQGVMDAEPVEEGSSPTRRIALVLVLGLSTVAAVISLVVVVTTLMQDLLARDFSAATLRSARYGLGVLVTAAVVAGYHVAVWREDRAAVARARRVDGGGIADEGLERRGAADGTGPRVPASGTIPPVPADADVSEGAGAPEGSQTASEPGGPETHHGTESRPPLTGGGRDSVPWRRTVILVGPFPEELRQALAQRTGVHVEIADPGSVRELTLEELTATVSAHPDGDLLITGGAAGLQVFTVDPES